MATIRTLFSLFLAIFTSFSCFFPLGFSNPSESCRFDKIYQLGDSISDTGNFIRESPHGADSAAAKLPFGMTYFGKATGRCSNGLLMVDFMACGAGIPLLNPYKNPASDFTHGANFAVAGATALSSEVLAVKNISTTLTNSSLDIQVEWMSEHFKSICHDQRDCAQKFQNALFIVGEIGGNDYNYALLSGEPIESLKPMVPEVVQAITEAVRKVIDFGATRIVVPGNFPIGCLPVYLTMFQTDTSSAYDENKCLIELNNFSTYHNEQLQQAIERLRQEKPDVSILYGDYYNAFQYLLRVAPHMGFDMPNIQKVCCGTGGNYDLNPTKTCGDPDVPVCPEPNRRINWDGLHFTQRAYQIMAGWLMQDISPKFHCTSDGSPKEAQPPSGNQTTDLDLTPMMDSTFPCADKFDA